MHTILMGQALCSAMRCQVCVSGSCVGHRLLKREGLRVAHVPDVRAAQQAAYNSARSAASGGPRQSTNEVLMVAPTAFGFNAQAAQDNSFMHSSVSSQQAANPGSSVTDAVLREFAGLYRELTEVRLLLPVGPTALMQRHATMCSNRITACKVVLLPLERYT